MNNLSCGRLNTKYKLPTIKIQKHLSYLNHTMILLCNNSNLIDCSNTIIFVGILTRPECLYERMVMRRMINGINDIKYIFITGTSTNKKINIIIKQEIKVYNDMIIFGVESSYYNCSIIMSCFYLYINRNCKNIKWIMKLDIDTYFNITMIFDVIKYCDKNISVIGSIRTAWKFKCNKNYKWSISCLNNSQNYINMPLYPFGPGFLFKSSSVKCISEYIGRKENIIWIEDIFFGMIMNYCNLKYKDISKIAEITYRPKYSLSAVKNKIFIHGLHPIEGLLNSLSNI